MLKTHKSQLTCSYCSRIFKDPILLPCDDNICRQHLKERDVIKQNKLKCKKCNEEFEVKNNQFKLNEAISKLIESHSYLNETEMSLKRELEVSIKKFFDIFEHFQEMRYQIDEHREKLKEKIDEIALKMIDDSKKYEALYLRNIKEKLFQTQSFESLEKELKEIEELFRNPNLLIQ
jgi:hypothetical protein